MGYDRGYSFPFDFLNQMEFHLVQNREENCHHDHIPFNVKGNGIVVFSVQRNLAEILLSRIVNTVHRLIRHQSEFCLVPDQTETGEYNLISMNLAKNLK